MQENYKIHLNPISDEDIAQQNISLSDLWMIQMPDNSIYGPFTTVALKDYSAKNIKQFDDAHCYNLQSEQWKSFYNTTHFQRRQPRLVPSQSLISNDNFHVLSNGKKHGPYSLNTLREMVQASEVSLNTQVSVDDGQSWIKLYEHHEFDRRTRKAARDSLPFVPQEEIFKNIEQSTQKSLQKMKKRKDEEDALVGLAFIGHGNDKGQILDSQTKKSSQQNMVDGDLSSHENSSDDLAQYRNESKGALIHTWNNIWEKSKEFFVKYPKFTAAVLTASLVSLVWLNQNPTARRDIASEFKKSQRQKLVSEKKLTDKDKTDSISKTKRITARKKIVRKPKKLERPRKQRSWDGEDQTIKRTVKNRRNRTKRRRPSGDYENFRDQDDRDQNDADQNYQGNDDYLAREKSQRFENMLDVDDPRVEAELSREFAGDYMPELDDKMPVNQDFIERFESGDISPEMEAELERRIEHYEEVSDFD